MIENSLFLGFISLYLWLCYVLCVAFDIYARHFEYSGSTPARHVYVRLKTSGAAIKIARETTNNQ